jgi:soluble lytic murein transglycosylase-like protein
MAGRGARALFCALLLVALQFAIAGCGGGSAPTSPSPQQAADRLTRTDAALRVAIDDWRAGGDPPPSAPPQRVLDQAAALQSDARFLTEHPGLDAQVTPQLPGPLAAELRRLVRADMDLLRLSHGAVSRHLSTGAPAPLPDLVGFYREGQRRYGIAWSYLAAINLVETKFGRVKNDSVAGAQGPMQFIPSTWAIYGHGGDVHDPHDAILAAADLLHNNGAPSDYPRALRSYNDSGLYVDAVSQYAREIAANPYGIYYLYSWLP